MSDQRFADIPQSCYLNSVDHLAFVLDHEVFHCLDAYYNGPMPISSRPHAAPYAAYRNESGADAFGAAMRLRDSGSDHYVRNLIHIRALTLVQEDPEHFTDRSMCRVLYAYPAEIDGKTVGEVFAFASRVRDQEVSDYEAYVAFVAAVLRASERLGVPVAEHRRAQFAGVEADADATDALVFRVLSSYRQLFARSG